MSRGKGKELMPAADQSPEGAVVEPYPGALLDGLLQGAFHMRRPGFDPTELDDFEPINPYSDLLKDQVGLYAESEDPIARGLSRFFEVLWRESLVNPHLLVNEVIAVRVGNKYENHCYVIPRVGAAQDGVVQVSIQWLPSRPDLKEIVGDVNQRLELSDSDSQLHVVVGNASEVDGVIDIKSWAAPYEGRPATDTNFTSEKIDCRTRT